ncbi:putative exported protein [Bordetella bronchiseptica MO211]|nr:putative exported protein [Bordetella bronchiseptica MO211]
MNQGLLYLAASVACSVTVAVLLKLARRHAIDVRQAIAVNYAVAAALCWLLLRPDAQALRQAMQGAPVLAALAVLLPTVFVAMARSVRYAGIVKSDAAQRLSLFIPLLAAFALFGESLTARKLAAIALAFAALACLLRRRAPAGAAADDAPDDRRAAWMWPLAVWAGYGVIDILFLGLANFGNILTYVRAHQSLPDHPALVFGAMNMGVITAGTLVGALAFRERLSALNLAGLALALAAIAAMLPW